MNKKKAIDFGIAGMATHFSIDNVDAGSLRYMAPELVTGTWIVDKYVGNCK